MDAGLIEIKVIKHKLMSAPVSNAFRPLPPPAPSPATANMFAPQDNPSPFTVQTQPSVPLSVSTPVTSSLSRTVQVSTEETNRGESSAMDDADELGEVEEADEEKDNNVKKKRGITQHINYINIFLFYCLDLRSLKVKSIAASSSASLPSYSSIRS
jgi:hypothetical protein